MSKVAAHTDITEGIAENGAQIHVILTEMGAADTVSSCNLILKGDESEADLDILYLGDGTRSVDISSRAEHRGRKSVSNIRARGVLLGQSKKIFRDTIDFISGSSGSKAAFSSVLQAVPDISLQDEILEILQKSILKGGKNI